MITTHYGRRYYSVPYTLVHQKLELRATKATVEVYKGGRRVASHAREHGRRRYITDPAHMPPSHRAHLEWTPSRLVDWARSVSPHPLPWPRRCSPPGLTPGTPIGLASGS